jgi:hypothetical protein
MEPQVINRVASAKVESIIDKARSFNFMNVFALMLVIGLGLFLYRRFKLKTVTKCPAFVPAAATLDTPSAPVVESPKED